MQLRVRSIKNYCIVVANLSSAKLGLSNFPVSWDDLQCVAFPGHTDLLFEDIFFENAHLNFLSLDKCHLVQLLLCDICLINALKREQFYT